MPVKFEQAIAYVTKHFQPTIYVEISPHITLRSNVRDIYILSCSLIPLLSMIPYRYLYFLRSKLSCIRANHDPK
jgi:hypothetical protein